MHFYQFHIGDYLKDTNHLTDDEDLAYRRLLDLYYDGEGPIPDDIARVARRVRRAEADVLAVLTEFFELESDGWHSKRCDEEIAKYRAMQEGGRKGAHRRWDKQAKTPAKGQGNRGENGEAIGGASPPQTPPNANHEPITKNQYPLSIERGAQARADRSGGKFSPPSKQETADFFREHGSTNEEAGRFWYHFDASGWTLGSGRKMKSWQSAAHKWILNSKTKYANGNGTQTQRRNGTLADQQPIDDAAALRIVERIAADPRYT